MGALSRPGEVAGPVPPEGPDGGEAPTRLAVCPACWQRGRVSPLRRTSAGDLLSDCGCGTGRTIGDPGAEAPRAGRAPR